MGELLDTFLSRKKQNEDTISKSLMSKLISIEKEILKRKQAIEDAQNILKSNSINIKAISEKTNISRKTFYNNKILAEFVEEHTVIDTSKAYEENKKLRCQLSDAEKKLFALLERDAETETLRFQISKLESELENSYKRIQILEQQHEQDSKKLKEEQESSHTYFN